MSGLEALVDELAHRVAAIVVAQLREGPPGMVDQNASPLGPRRHCAAAKRRMARGEAGASKVGRRYLLSPEALSEELGRASRRRSAPEGASAMSPAEELRRELAVLRGGRSRA
jgi:hypothetical protein